MASSINIAIKSEDYIDEALTPDQINFKSFIEVEEINDKFQYVYNKANWKFATNQQYSR